MKTRTREHTRVKENIIKPSGDILTKIIFRTLIGIAIFHIFIVPPLIFLGEDSIFGAILILLLEIVCFPAIYLMLKKVLKTKMDDVFKISAEKNITILSHRQSSQLWEKYKRNTNFLNHHNYHTSRKKINIFKSLYQKHFIKKYLKKLGLVTLFLYTPYAIMTISELWNNFSTEDINILIGVYIAISLFFIVPMSIKLALKHKFYSLNITSTRYHRDGNNNIFFY